MLLTHSYSKNNAEMDYEIKYYLLNGFTHLVVEYYW
jgi:hypothetical protein